MSGLADLETSKLVSSYSTSVILNVIKDISEPLGSENKVDHFYQGWDRMKIRRKSSIGSFPCNNYMVTIFHGRGYCVRFRFGVEPENFGFTIIDFSKT